VFGSIRDDCDQMTGRCRCRPGITGHKCHRCPNGATVGPQGCTGTTGMHHIPFTSFGGLGHQLIIHAVEIYWQLRKLRAFFLTDRTWYDQAIGSLRSAYRYLQRPYPTVPSPTPYDVPFSHSTQRYSQTDDRRTTERTNNMTVRFAKITESSLCEYSV